jgi:prolyl oligopeptidase
MIMKSAWKAPGKLVAAVLGSAVSLAAQSSLDDPFLFLESSNSPAALAWVTGQNTRTVDSLSADGRFNQIENDYKAFIADTNRPAVVRFSAGGYVYNYWKDLTNVRGIWRRTRFIDYTQTNVPWEILLDMDALAARENEDWVFSGAVCLPPAGTSCLIKLSRSGRDAVVIREFDVTTKSFVADGFVLPEAKSFVSWIDADTIFVGTDWGAGTMTTSGYPAEVRAWKRGTNWQDAALVYGVSTASVAVEGLKLGDSTGQIQLVLETPSSNTSKWWIRSVDGKMSSLNVPLDAIIDGYFHGQLIMRLRSIWTVGTQTFSPGSLIAYDPISNAAASIYTPTATSSLDAVNITSNFVIVSVLDNIVSRLFISSLTIHGWQNQELTLPGQGVATITTASGYEPLLLVWYSSFLEAGSLYRLDPGGSDTPQTPVKRQMPRFNASKMAYEQHFAKSADGTQVPYFLVHGVDIAMNGSSPTILTGYGGFGYSMKPSYLSFMGIEWLTKGGVYAVANIRGGGEFGPAWHEAAMKHNRQRSYDDFIAVAEDLIKLRVTSPTHLGITGGSNGGLLVGAVMVQRPDLFNAVVCAAPLLDMVRFPLLGVGASWIGEYGDPNIPEDLVPILRYSPYQNLKPNTTYPRPLFLTSTNDDRVTPAHARKMAAKMDSYGEQYYFYESREGGHGGPSSADEQAMIQAIQYTYFYQRLFNP